jgi:glycosyl transferase family 11
MPEDLTEIRNRPAIIVRLRGGLGNQLFQYAAGRSLASRFGAPLMLDTKSGFRSDLFGRSYALGAFALSNTVLEADSAGHGFCAELQSRLLRRHEILRLKLLGRYFSPSIQRLRVSGPTVLDAYCQSPRYFLGVEDALKEELAFKAIPAGVDSAIVNEIYFANSVCVHARRLLGACADRAKTRRSVVDYYGACGINYYRSALAKLAREHGPITAFLFSDDPAWARENASRLVTTDCTLKVIDEQDTLKSFYLMRLCKHFVLANSTFGWWAAWLGEFARKAVYVPSVWNRGEKRFPLELFPDGWSIVPTA